MIELSVVIPSHNRAERLRTCLQALARQTLPAETFEVVVVVDGSTDGTRQMLAELTVPFALKVFWQAKAGQCAALNRGAAEATGRYLVILDDDVSAAAGLLAAHLQAQRGRAGIVGIGRLTIAPPAGLDGFARYFARIWDGHYERLGQGQRAPAWRDCYSGNISMPRSAFAESGGFAADLRTRFDVELGYRLEQQGLTLVYLPEAAGAHDDFKNFHGLAADAEKQGREALELCQRHPPMLPVLLGSFGETTIRALLLCRLLLFLNLSSRVLALLSRLAENQPWEQVWYVFLHSYFYWRGVRQSVPDGDTWRRLTQRTPILMYHAFAGPGEPASRFVLPPRRFALQMAWLKWLGYRVISLDDYMADRCAYRLPPARAVVITIDDGFAEVLPRAHPILQRYGYPATLFLVSAMVGDANRWDRSGTLAGRPLLAWPDVQKLLREGMAMGAHTRTHPRLTSLPPEQALEEMSGSRAELEQKLNIPIRQFAYPFGDHNAETPALAQQAGFLGACSVHRGANDAGTPGFLLRRIEVAGYDSLLRFALALWFGDDHLPPRPKETE